MSDKKFLDQITAAGFSMFPCALSKKPMTTNGFKAATRDRSIIDKWDQSKSKKLWGIPAEPNGFFAVDVDPDGVETWQNWTRDNGLSEPTPWQRTPRGGAHYLFRLPQNVRVPNNAGKLAPGIDLRSTGYICTGEGYEWQIPIDQPVAEAPPWLIEKIKDLTAPKPQPPDTRTHTEIDRDTMGEYWTNKALTAARLGNRNQTGFDLALQLRDSGLTIQEAETFLVLYAHGVPQNEDYYSEDEAIASLREAYKGTPRQPATLPRSLTNQAIIESEAPITDQAQEPKPPRQQIPPEPEPPDYDPLELLPRYEIRGIDYILEDHPPIQYIINKIVEEASVNIWVGKFGSKKTWAAISAAVCVAAGKEWLELETKQSSVLIIDEESGERRLAYRIKQALAGELITEKIPISFISNAQFNLLKRPEDQDLLIKVITETGARLVIIDALVDIMAGGDENAVKDTQPVFVALRRITKVTNAAIVVIHHANRLGDYRGSSAIPGALETMIQIDSKEDSDFIVFKSLKIRDGEPIKFGARAVWVDGQFYLDQVPIQEKAFLTKSQQFTLDYFADNGPAKFTDLLNFAGELYTENTLRKAIQTLVNNKTLARIDDGGRRTEALYGVRKA